jgi:hypothetical protein
MSDPMICLHCGEPVLWDEPCERIPVMTAEGDAIRAHLGRMHRNCFLRGLLGGVGHIEGRCSCYGGTYDDPPEMTKREAADAAVRLWRERNQN